MSGEKAAPTAAEIADARRHLSGPIFDADRYVKVQASIRTLLAALDAAEARADTAENAGARLLLDLGKAKERAETAERERDEARAAGRKEILDKCRQRFPNSTFYLKWEEDAVLAALKEASRG